MPLHLTESPGPCSHSLLSFVPGNSVALGRGIISMWHPHPPCLAWGEQEAIIWKACSCVWETWPSPESALQNHTLLAGYAGGCHNFLLAPCHCLVYFANLPENVFLVGMWQCPLCRWGRLSPRVSKLPTWLGEGTMVSWQFTSSCCSLSLRNLQK